MKQNLLKTLLLASTLSMTICACGNETPSNDLSSDHVGTTDSVIDSSSDSSTDTPDEFPAIVELSRNVYIEGETVYPYVTRFDVYSPSTGLYRSKLRNYSVIMPTECPNGDAIVKIVSGSDVAEVTIKYYETVEKAVEDIKLDIPDDTSALFDESKYIDTNTGKLKFEVDVADGEISTPIIADKKGNKAEISVTAIDKNPPLIEWTANFLELWQRPERLQKAQYDPDKLTIEHFVDEEGVPHYNCTYLPEANYTSSAIYNYEIITDSTGKIVYLGEVKYTAGTWAHPDADDEYWSCYKDFKENPVFTYSKDYKAQTDEDFDDMKDSPRRDLFQKVLPDDGMWIIGYNCEPEKRSGYIDQLWGYMSGLTTQIHAADGTFKLTMDDANVEAALNRVRLKHKVGARQLYVYTVADIYQQYAYYYSQALASGNETVIAFRDEVFKTLIAVLLDEVKNEEILYKYYEDQVFVKLDEWKEIIN